MKLNTLKQQTQQTNRVVNTIESDVAYIGLYWPLELKSKVRNVVRRAYRCTPQTSANFTWRACDRTRELNVAVSCVIRDRYFL